MSEVYVDNAYYDNPRLNQSAPLNDTFEEMYHITRGTFYEFDMKG